MRQTENKSIARKKSYLKYLNMYPLQSTLIVLKEYEESQLFMECSIIKKALDEHKEKAIDSLPAGLKIYPTNLEMYNSKEIKDFFTKNNLSVNEKSALNKAKLIKANLPVK